MIAVSFLEHNASAQPVSDNMQYEQLGKIGNNLQKQGIKFDSIPQTTWSEMRSEDRLKVFEAYKVLDVSSYDALKKRDALNEITGKSKLLALENRTKYSDVWKDIAKSQGIDLKDSKTLKKDWSEILREPKTYPYNAEDAAGLLLYGSVEQARPQPIRTKKDPSKEMGLPGQPSPQDPGLPVLPVTKDIKVSSIIDCRVLSTPSIDKCKYSHEEVGIRLTELILANGVRRPDRFNPLGFLEVVKIEHVSADLTCTGTLLSALVVLTAAHCLDKLQPADIVVFAPRLDGKTLAECQKILGSNRIYQQCVSLDRHFVKSIRRHDGFDIETRLNDVALMTLVVPVASGKKASVTFLSKAPPKITMAGYGENGDPKRSDKSQNALEVGWYRSNEITDLGDKISWSQAVNKGESVTCPGDSGGPVYSGDYVGGSEDAASRKIFAVTTEAQKSEKCAGHIVKQTKLSSAPIKKWLCTQSDFKELHEQECGPANPLNVPTIASSIQK